MIGLSVLAVVTALTGNWEFRKVQDGTAVEGRRMFSLDAEDRDNLHMDGRAYLEFDGVPGRSEAFVNGQKAGGAEAWRPCTFDITKLIRKGANEVVLKVASEEPVLSDVFARRLLREARLRVCPHPHPIPGTLEIQIERLADGMAEMVARYGTPWGPESKRWKMEKPRFWTPEDPYLYELDIYGFKIPYGIRTVRCEADGTLFLNGKRMAVKGVDFDSSGGALGRTYETSALKRQLRMMKAGGVNVIRTDKVCPVPQLFEMCDEMGLLVLDATRTNAKRGLQNHPSDVTEVLTEVSADYPAWRTGEAPGLKAVGGEAVGLKLTADPFQPDDPAALRFLCLTAVDKSGANVSSALPKVVPEISGPGEIVAMESEGSSGLMSVIVRRTGEGAISLRVRAEGLESAQYALGGVIRAEAGLAGLKAAQELVRQKKAAQPNEPWTVVVPAGEIRLDETLSFGTEDAGRPGAPVVWKGEGVTIRGGVDVGPWTDEGDGVVSAPIPVGADGRRLALDMLFVNGERASRSILPKNRGSFKIPGGEEDSRATTLSTNEAGLVTHAKERTRLNEDAAAVLDAVAPEDLPFVQMQIRLDWTQARRRVVGWDKAKREVLTEAFGGRPRDTNNRWCERTAIRFENVRAAFVDPGEWFYDAKAGKVLYRLREGETAATLKSVAPANRLSKLLTFEKTHDLRFEGFTFEYADAPQGGVADDPGKFNQTYRCQSAGTYDATVELRYAERVEFVRCRVARSGNYAFRIADGCRHVALRRCETWDTGAGGIWLGSAKMHFPGGKARRRMLQPTEPESCAFNVIEDCRLRHGGRFNPEGTAVFVTHASDCRIEHNEIDDWYYSGVTVGYTWGYSGSPSQRNVIAFNRISRLGQHELSDMGGIYTLATSFGTVVSNNVISEVFGYDTAAWGLYADEGSEGIVFENNVVSHTEFGGVNQHYGSGCVVRNNIIAYNDARGCLSASRREAMGVPSTLHITGNIFYTHKGPLACRGAMEVEGIWAHNVWWKEGGPAKDDFDLRSAEEFLASGRAYGDVVADPLFVDAKNGDFRLKPESPALKLGFREWDHSLAGPRPER